MVLLGGYRFDRQESNATVWYQTGPTLRLIRVEADHVVEKLTRAGVSGEQPLGVKQIVASLVDDGGLVGQVRSCVGRRRHGAAAPRPCRAHAAIPRFPCRRSPAGPGARRCRPGRLRRTSPMDGTSRTGGSSVSVCPTSTTTRRSPSNSNPSDRTPRQTMGLGGIWPGKRRPTSGPCPRWPVRASSRWCLRSRTRWLREALQHRSAPNQ